STILITNLVMTIFAYSRYGSKNGVGLIYHGDCSTVKQLDRWLHLLINILSTGMLSASNFCMQLQAAPTRGKVDAAHEEGKWLDIGIHSLRNLRYLDKRQRISWALLALTSIPIHLMGFILVVVEAFLLSRATASLRLRNFKVSIIELWKLGFGELTPYTYLYINMPRTDPAGLIANVILANMPQIILSVVYILYNTMLSTFLFQREFSRMCERKRRKPLRVSEPVGIQRSSYSISLPLRYGIPLSASSTLMHWVVSQSLFLARVRAVQPDGSDDDVNSFSTCGHSPIALFSSMIGTIAIMLVIVGLGLRRYDGTMRMVSTNSLAISAACHVLPEDRENGYLLPVQWGVVEMKGGVGKCAMTTAAAETIRLPKVGLGYM
ncbi:hypothetical protein LZ31DRAFT_461910, partial [Colletotrichum somersetense]